MKGISQTWALAASLFAVALLMPQRLSAQSKNMTPEEIRQYAAQQAEAIWHEYFTETVDSVKVDGQMCRHGDYLLKYKGKTIEKGRYDKGRKVGAWIFWNYQNLVELRYDFDSETPQYIVQHIGHKYSKTERPCVFLGSPIVPYYFILSNVFYPQSEGNRNGGKVILAIKVDADGRMSGYRIKESTSANFAKAVRVAADMIPTDKWRWLPALKGGKPVSEEYDIVIYFDN
ncbi:MAG: energy transducer TonB [Bacteroidales bacterium]|nr:energy transducer TonB [Bacteroidales bacterium]MDD7725972.1 energy transducer TonB [Bacteroidales bacterium]MDY4173822.1 energy transducer TonB [Bacteroidales bacterium]